MLLLTACFKNNDCDQSIACNSVRPDSGYLNISVTDPGSGGFVPITIYKGDIDKGEVVLEDTLYSRQNSYYLPIEQRYGVKATYVKAGITTFVYDGAKIKLKKFWNCDEQCFDAADGNINVELK